MLRHPKTKIIHHKHSGKLRPHEYTSYGALGVLLVVVGIALTVFTAAASPGPQGGSIGLSGTMPGPPPKTAATITTPSSGQHFSTSPITVSGTCPAGTLVEIFKNNIFAGSTPCNSQGTYSLQIDLLVGANSLTAEVYNALNESGPGSTAVAVSYDALPPQASSLAGLSFGGAQLLLSTDTVYRGVFPDQQLSVPVQILGGTPPYAVNVQWGDSSNNVVPRSNSLSFTVTHTYKKPGNYEIILQATDAQGRMAFLSVAAIVNGQPAGATGSTGNTKAESRLLVLWPLYTSALAIVVSFWLGERREKYVLAGIPLRPHPQH